MVWPEVTPWSVRCKILRSRPSGGITGLVCQSGRIKIFHELESFFSFACVARLVLRPNVKWFTVQFRDLKPVRGCSISLLLVLNGCWYVRLEEHVATTQFSSCGQSCLQG